MLVSLSHVTWSTISEKNLALGRERVYEGWEYYLEVIEDTSDHDFFIRRVAKSSCPSPRGLARLFRQVVDRLWNRMIVPLESNWKNE